MTYFFRVIQSRGVGAKVIKYSKNKQTSWMCKPVSVSDLQYYTGRHYTLLSIPNLLCLQRANWRHIYAAFLKISIQNGQKLISLAWISLQLLQILLICLKEEYSWKYHIWCQDEPLFCNTNLHARLALVCKPHICTTEECFEVGEVFLAPHQ